MSLSEVERYGKVLAELEEGVLGAGHVWVSLAREFENSFQMTVGRIAGLC